MTERISEFVLPIMGCAFEIDDHGVIADWAKQQDHRAVVRLDHGVIDEEYEEVVELRYGVSDRCRFIVWRTMQSVFVQPLIGRRQRYASVREALDGLALNKAVREYSHARMTQHSAA
jgi:hypothetical protein